MTPEAYVAIVQRMQNRIDAQDNMIRDQARRIERFRETILVLLNNDPNELAADGGITVLDVWRKQARKIV